MPEGRPLVSSDPLSSSEPLPALEVDVASSGGATMVRVAGELDMATVDVLRQALDAQHGAVVLDLRRVEFIDAAGLRLLLEADARSRADGLHLTLIPGRVVDRLLGLTATRARFRIRDPRS